MRHLPGSRVAFPDRFRATDAPRRGGDRGGPTLLVASSARGGGFSFVHLAREIPDARGEDFALKRVLLHEAEHARAVEREMATMRLFDHPNILPLLLGDVEPLPPGASPGTTRRASLVFPVYPEGTLLDRALDRPIAEALTPVQLLSVTRQICLALRCMHEHPDGPSRIATSNRETSSSTRIPPRKAACAPCSWISAARDPPASPCAIGETPSPRKSAPPRSAPRPFAPRSCGIARRRATSTSASTCGR